MCTLPPMQLYYFSLSPPSRAVMMMARAVRAELDMHHVDILKGEHLTVDFIQMNPQHTVPTFVQGDLVLTESRAILGYLADRYAEDDSLYPADPRRRALVNQRLFFDAATLHQRTVDYMAPVVFRGLPPSEEGLRRLEEAYGYFDRFLEGDEWEWVAGDRATIADYSLAVTTSNGVALGVRLEHYPNVSRWYKQAKSTLEGFEDINQPAADKLGELFREKIPGGRLPGDAEDEPPADS